MWGWKFAVGFVLLLLVHECGHLIVAKKFGLKVGAPVFIPFMGAFIALKEAPRNAWMEACVGIGGPMLGSLGAFALQCDWRNIRRSYFFRARLVRLFPESLQSDAGGNAGWWPNRNRVITLALVARIRRAALVRVEIPELYRLADGDCFFAANHLVVPKTDRRRTPLLRSNSGPTLDNVDLVFRSDRDFGFRDASGAK